MSLALAGALAVAMTACKGDQGPPGPPGGSGTGGGSGALTPTARLYAKPTAATIPNGGGKGGVPTLTYRLYRDSAFTEDAGTCAGGGSTGYEPFSPNFTIAKLVNDEQNPGTKRWQSYINKTVNGVKVATIEGAHDTIAGTLKDNGDGSCTYTYKSDLSQMVAVSDQAVVTEAYDPAAVTRFGMQNNPSEPDVTHPGFDGFLDLSPGAGQVLSANARAIVATAACNQCHRDLAHHGAKRFSTEYCVTCHNAGTPDPDPTSENSTSLNLAVMVHKIHQGKNLSSVTGKQVNGTAIPGAVKGKLVINGTDYTEVGFPQDTGNCTVCHAATTGTGNDWWKTQSSIETCGACHDRVDFAAGSTGTPKPGFYAHPGTAGAVADGACAECHAEGKSNPTTSFHKIGVPTLAQEASTYKVVSVTNSAPSATPTITISVTNPASNNAAQDLATDPLWTQTATGNSRLFVTLGWTVKPGEDWDNSGAGNGAGQPVTIDVLASIKAAPGSPPLNKNGSWTVAATKNGDGTYTLPAPMALPAGAVGSGVVLIEGHPASAAGTRLAVTNGTAFFPITDATATARRQVVDIQKCDKCHGKLSAHGNNRTDNIDGCVVCHNAQATDISQRPGGTTAGVDGKIEQTIQFGAMIHGLHAGKEPPYTQGLVVYGFGKSVNDFGEVKFPEGNTVAHCDACHAASNPFPSAQVGIVNGITITTGGATITDQATYLRTTTVAGICSSCHQSTQPATHMAQNGAVGVATVGTTTISGLGLTQAAIDNAGLLGGTGAEACTVCHSKGSIVDPALFHGK